MDSKKELVGKLSDKWEWYKCQRSQAPSCLLIIWDFGKHCDNASTYNNSGQFLSTGSGIPFEVKVKSADVEGYQCHCHPTGGSMYLAIEWQRNAYKVSCIAEVSCCQWNDHVDKRKTTSATTNLLQGRGFIEGHDKVRCNISHNGEYFGSTPRICMCVTRDHIRIDQMTSYENSNWTSPLWQWLDESDHCKSQD